MLISYIKELQLFTEHLCYKSQWQRIKSTVKLENKMQERGSGGELKENKEIQTDFTIFHCRVLKN